MDRILFCDDCMKEFDQTGFGDVKLSYDEQSHFAKEDGWKIIGMFNFCPDCQGECYG